MTLTLSLIHIWDNFGGWAGLPPIAELIEFIIGIRGDYAKKQIIWGLNLTEINVIERYPFGPEGLISLKAEARRSASDEPRSTVDSNCLLYTSRCELAFEFTDHLYDLKRWYRSGNTEIKALAAAELRCV